MGTEEGEAVMVLALPVVTLKVTWINAMSVETAGELMRTTSTSPPAGTRDGSAFTPRVAGGEPEPGVTLSQGLVVLAENDSPVTLEVRLTFCVWTGPLRGPWNVMWDLSTDKAALAPPPGALTVTGIVKGSAAP